MKLNNYLKEKKESVSVVLLGVSVFLGIMILVKVRGFFVTSAWAEEVVKRAVAQSEPDANNVKEHLAESKTIADELKKKNLFAPPTPKKHPVNQVLGIMGSEALINGKWYKAGDKVGDAKIVAIEPALVRILWDGKEKTFAPMQAAGPSAPGGPRRGGPEMASRTEGGPRAGAAMVVVGPDRMRGPGRGGFGEEGFRGMRERFQNMSEEERNAFRERMRERFGGRRGPGGEGGRGGRGR